MSRPPRVLTKPVRVGTWAFYSWPPPTGWENTYGTIVNLPIHREVIISDDSTPWRGRNKRCLHYKWSKSVHTVEYDLNRTVYGPNRTLTYLDYDPMPFAWRAFNDYYRPYDVDWDRVVASRLPNLRNNFNAINFALEFGELRDLASRMRNLREELSLLDPRLPGRSSRQLANDFLTYRFGIAPLVGDIGALADQWSHFGERLGRLRAMLRKGERCRIKPATYRVSRTIPGQFRSHTGHLFNGTYSITGTFTEVAGCTIKGDDRDYNNLRQFADYIGFYPDFNTLWNAIPFSFLVDYFMPVGDLLDRSPIGNYNITASDGWYSGVLDATWSVQVTTPVASNLLENYSLGKLRELYTRGTVRIYMREPIAPSLDGIDTIMRVGAPGSGQMANIAALGVANFRVRR